MDAGLSEEPKLLRKGLIVPDEVDKLFKIFFEKLNVCVPPSPSAFSFYTFGLPLTLDRSR